MTWATGEVIVLREVLDGRVRSARPLRVVEDGPDALVGYLAPRSDVAWPRRAGAAQSQTPDQGWRLAREQWHGPGCLFVLPAGEAFAAVLFLDHRTGQPLSWKVDFLAPPHRHAVGLDTLDWALDLLVPLDLSSWAVKDEDDLAQLELVGVLGTAEGAEVRAARRRVEALVASRSAPFSGRWAAWRPPAGFVAPLELPPRWDRLGSVDPTRRPDTDPVGRRAGRSGEGTRLLDERGRVVLDLDLADGMLLHGHAHPRLVEAVTRQAALGLGPSGGYGAVDALAERLARRIPTVEAVAWAGSGDEAWWRGVRAARRATGRRRVACWRGAPPLGGDDGDEDLVVLPDDPAAALRQLTAGGASWGALIVDPLALASTAADHPLLAALAGGVLAPGAVRVADERRSFGAGPAGGHGRLGLRADLVVLGAGLFGGLGGGALAGRRPLLTEAAARSRPPLPPSGFDGRPDAALHPVLAAAGLATLALASPEALDELGTRAGRLRQRFGLAGLGPAIRLPPAATPARLAARGVAVNGSGWAWLATVTDDDDVAEVAGVLEGLARTDQP